MRNFSQIKNFLRQLSRVRHTDIQTDTNNFLPLHSNILLTFQEKKKKKKHMLQNIFLKFQWKKRRFTWKTKKGNWNEMKYIYITQYKIKTCRLQNIFIITKNINPWSSSKGYKFLLPDCKKHLIFYTKKKKKSHYSTIVSVFRTSKRKFDFIFSIRIR